MTFLQSWSPTNFPQNSRKESYLEERGKLFRGLSAGTSLINTYQGVLAHSRKVRNHGWGIFSLACTELTQTLWMSRGRTFCWGSARDPQLGRRWRVVEIRVRKADQAICPRETQAKWDEKLT